MQPLATALTTPAELFRTWDAHRRKNDWAAIEADAHRLPADLSTEWLPAADALVFALGQLGEVDRAIRLAEAVWQIEPSHRRASSLAYLTYSALFMLAVPRRRPQPRADREAYRQGFRRWIAEALMFDEGSIKDLYRLGVFEAQLESAHDKVALRAFRRAIDAYQSLDPEERERRHDLRSYFVRALYAGARSALRLGETKLARGMAFGCIREDERRDQVAPIFKLGLAAKVCLQTGELDHAERAARKALDAKGPPRRDHLFGLLANVARQRGDLDAAVAWIEGKVRPEQRSAAMWRQLGDLRLVRGELDLAEAAFRTSLGRDRAGRHLTLVRIARLERSRGKLDRAAQACREALSFRRKKYLSEDPAALAELEQILRQKGDEPEARLVGDRLAKCKGRGFADHEHGLPGADVEEVA